MENENKKKEKNVNKKNEKKQLENEKKNFIREQIKPDKSKIAKKVGSRIVITLLLAFFFGAVAGTTIFIVNHVLKLNSPLSDETVVDPSNFDITSEEPETTLEPAGTNLNAVEITTIEDYNNVKKLLSSVGENCNSFIVSVISAENVDDWFDSGVKNDNSHAGMVFKIENEEYYILTSGIDSDDDLSVRFKEGSRTEAELVATNKQLKISIIKVAASKVPDKVRKNLKAAVLASGVNIEKGTVVIAIGSPNGIMYSVDSGSVTNNSISVPVIDGQKNILLTDMTLCDESEGFVVDTAGNVIGIVTKEYPGKTGTSTIAFMDINGLIEELNVMMGDEKGTYFGIEGVDVTKEAVESEGLPEGVYVTEIIPDSPAFNSDLRVADVITKIDDKEIKGLADFSSQLKSLSPGTEVKVTIERENSGKFKKSTFKLELDEN